MASVTRLGPYAGSKKAARRKARDERRERALKTRLGKIYDLARLLKTEEELDTYLAQIPDDAVRAETRKLIEPFCTFKFRKLEVVSSMAQVDAMRTPPEAPTILPPATTPKGLFTENADGAMPFEKDYRAAESRVVNRDLPHDVEVRGLADILAKCFDIAVLELMKAQGFDAFLLKVRAADATLPPGTIPAHLSVDEWRSVYGYLMRHLTARKARKDLRTA